MKRDLCDKYKDDFWNLVVKKWKKKIIRKGIVKEYDIVLVNGNKRETFFMFTNVLFSFVIVVPQYFSDFRFIISNTSEPIK